MGKAHEQTFANCKTQMGNRHLERCSGSSVTGKMQIETTGRFHITPVGILGCHPKEKKKHISEMKGKDALIHCWWECEPVQTLWKMGWRVFRKLKTDLTYASFIPLMGLSPKEMKSVHESYLCPHVYSNSLSLADICNQPRCPSSGTHTHTHGNTQP